MSSQRDVTVKALSSNLLQMKFMKRSAMDIQKSDEIELFKDSAEHWVLDGQYSRQHKNDLDIQLSHALCEDLPFGRMSFKGFNPAIEKLMKVMNGEEEAEEKISEEDKNFAESYASVSNIAKKFTSKRQRAGGSHHSRQSHGQGHGQVSKPKPTFLPKRGKKSSKLPK